MQITSSAHMTSEFRPVLSNVQSGLRGPHLTSRVKCRLVLKITWKFSLDVADNPLGNIVLATTFLMFTRRTTACV